MSVISWSAIQKPEFGVLDCLSRTPDLTDMYVTPQPVRANCTFGGEDGDLPPECFEPLLELYEKRSPQRAAIDEFAAETKPLGKQILHQYVWIGRIECCEKCRTQGAEAVSEDAR
jgi:hypothetical protein